MAKRFADTRLGREKWFRTLGPVMKCGVRFLFDECDEAGVWAIDEEAMAFYVGAPIALDVLIDNVNKDGKHRLVRIGRDKLYITGFVSFQYGELSPDCRPHQKVFTLLKSHGLWGQYLEGLNNPIQTVSDTLSNRVKDKDKDKEEDQEEEKEGGVGGKPPRFQVSEPEVTACLVEWKQTLEHFEIDRALGMQDEVAIARAVRDFSGEWVRLAFQGARKQKAGPRFDPKQFVSLKIYLHKDRIERLVNIGAGRESVDGIDWSKVFAP